MISQLFYTHLPHSSYMNFCWETSMVISLFWYRAFSGLSTGKLQALPYDVPHSTLVNHGCEYPRWCSINNYFHFCASVFPFFIYISLFLRVLMGEYFRFFLVRGEGVLQKRRSSCIESHIFRSLGCLSKDIHNCGLGLFFLPFYHY